MKKAILCVLAVLFAWNMLLAVPAIKKPITVKQADGTTITIYLRGDENTKWHETLDGYSLMKVENQFYYAVLDKDGNMVASKVKAHDQDQRTRQEKKLLRKTPHKLRYSPQQLSQMRARGPVALANSPARTLANSSLTKAFKARKTLTDTVVRRAPIILVNFADRKMTTPKENYDELVNAANYTKNGCTGSFQDYFLANSRGLFRFEADVIGPVTLSKNMAYYGGNYSSGGDAHPQEMAAEACRLAAESGVDFSQYDFDKDGIVDGVHIIFPGKGEETSDEDDAIWSHMWNLDETLKLNGKRVDVYSCSAEISFWGDWACIGTLVHELSHVFGLPDLYDSDYKDNGGESVTPGEFDVMDDGTYNNDGKTPPLHNAWSRIQMGWLDEVELTEACQVKLYPAEEATQAFYYNTPVKGEYFVLDYRGEESKWDAYIPGYGMLIFAVDENAEIKYGRYSFSAWERNCINCVPDNRGFYIKQADGGKNSNASMGTGTPFPGKSNKTSFTDETAPASTTHSGQKTGKPITDIEEMEEGGVSFVFIEQSSIIRDNMGNSNASVPVSMPEFNPAGGAVTAGTEVTITTETEDADIYYTLDGSEPTRNSTRYSLPIVINEAVTLKAIAVKEDMEDSKIATAKYTIKKDPSVANESEEDAGIKVYPNPNNGNFYLELPENAEVSVFGLNGSLLKRRKLETGLHEMRIDRSGTYVLRIDTGKASVSKRVTVR